MLKTVRFALRQMRKRPGFAALVLVTLALGIGANTAMFTVIDSVMLRPLPYPDADKIMAITTGQSQGNAVQPTSWLNYVDLREQAGQFRAVAAYTQDVAIVRTSQESEAVLSLKGTAGLFDVLGVKARFGRRFLDTDNQPGAPNVLMLSSGFWQDHFGANPNVLGQQVRVGDDSYTIVGVLPADLRFGGKAATSGIWIPYQPNSTALRDRSSDFLNLIVLLGPGVSQQAAEAQATAIARGIAQRDPQHAGNLRFRLIPFRDVVTAKAHLAVLALTGAVTLVLLIACANVANLQLARCLARGQELAIRTALGASRRILFMQMLVEGGVLCVFAAVAGLGVAQLVLLALRGLPPNLIPRADEIHLRLSVFPMLLLATSVVTLLSSIVPAVVATLSDPQAVLQEGARGSSHGRGRSRLSSFMVVGEVALSVVLLVSGGLMFRTLSNLQHTDLGFEEHNLTSFLTIPASSSGFFATKNTEGANQQDSIAIRVYQPMQERLQHLPGVVDAAFSSVIPFEDVAIDDNFDVVGRLNVTHNADRPHALIRVVSASYTRVMGTRIVRGRSISDADTAGSPSVAIVNESLAKRYFAGQDPIGQKINLAADHEKDRNENGMPPSYTIIGVVADAVQSRIAQPVAPEISLPYSQIPVKSAYYQLLVASEAHYVIKTHGSVSIFSAVRAVFHQYVPDFAVENFQTIQAAHDSADSSQRVGVYLVALFAGIATVMVLVGLYGVLSQLVGQRKREIAIRMALGADRISVIRLILGHGFIVIGSGLTIGLGAALVVVQWFRSFLYEVSPVDAVTYGGVSVTLALVGLIAAFVPARRAASVEVSLALRGE